MNNIILFGNSLFGMNYELALWRETLLEPNNSTLNRAETNICSVNLVVEDKRSDELVTTVGKELMRKRKRRKKPFSIYGV